MPSPPPPCLAAALEYRERGWSALPLCPADHENVPGFHEQECTRPGKEPIWPWQAYQERRARPAELHLLWAKLRTQNVGICLGPVSGLVGLDVDGSAGERLLAYRSQGAVPETLEFITPGGSRRLLFRWPETALGAPLPSVAGDGALRVLGQGSLTVMPPSLHQFGGSYAWVPARRPGVIEPAPCPPWLLDLWMGLPNQESRKQRTDESGGEEHQEPQVRSRGIPVAPSGTERAQVHTRKFADLETRPVAWLWPGWVPLGKLTLLDGDPGLGKSTVLLDLAARVSQRGVMPDGAQGLRGNVVILSAEDGAEDTIGPRLAAAGAALDRVHDLSYVLDRGEPRCPEIPRDLPLLESKLAEVDARLLIIDPLAAFLCGSDANKDQEIRRVLYRLSRVAERRRCAVLSVRHLNKGTGGKALYRGNMSIGVIGHARAGLLVAPDPDDDAGRVLAVTKCNLAARPASLRFTLAAAGPACRVVWNGTSAYQADQLVQRPPSAAEKEAREEARTKQQLAEELLRLLLAEGPVAVKRAKAEAASAGISARVLERAARALRVKVSFRHVEGKRVYTYSRAEERRGGAV
jgi:hypothetical protein